VVHRSQLLPSGGGLEDSDYDELGRRVRDSLDRARRLGRMRRTEAAERLWAGMYGALAHRETSGVVAAVTDRAEAQCLRLSMVFAALDGTAAIDARHLEAAWAVLWYCEQSARVIFGDAAEDRVSGRILTALRQKPDGQGLDRTQLHKLFGGNVKAAVLDDALDYLQAADAVECVKADTEGRGRPRLVYFLTPNERNETNELARCGLAPFTSATSFLSYSPASAAVDDVTLVTDVTDREQQGES
jgi:DNA-binding PadR family transcriptional regulator